MTDHYVSLTFAVQTLGASQGRVCAALQALGLQLISKDTTNRTTLCMPSRYISLLEKYFEREAATKISIAEAARQDGFPRGIYYRTATMLQMGTKLTNDDRTRIRKAIELHDAGRPWYQIIRELGNQTRPDQALDVIFNDAVDDAAPQIITVTQLAKEIKANYGTVQAWIAELGIHQSSVQNVRAVSLTDAERIRERAAKFPRTRLKVGQKRIRRVTETPERDR